MLQFHYRLVVFIPRILQPSRNDPQTLDQSPNLTSAANLVSTIAIPIAVEASVSHCFAACSNGLNNN